MIEDEFIPLLNLQEGVGLYFHIPFCKTKCYYCDFFSKTEVKSNIQTKILQKSLFQAQSTLQQLGLQQIETLYIGGGSPSLAPLEAIIPLIKLGKTLQAKEITIEANPEQLTAEWLKALKTKGVTRFSVGLQSFYAKSLQAVGRQVSQEALEKALQLLKPYSQMLNLDLIAGLPYQTETLLFNDIEKVLALKPAHISFYSLTVEEDTPLEKLTHLLPTHEQSDELWQLGKQKLNQAGYNDYEISNFALVGFECLHNRRYWDMKPYLGFGPSAVGNLPLKDGKALRTVGLKDFDTWLQEDNPCYTTTLIEKEDFMFEHFMMALRTQQGLDKKLFISRFGQTHLHQYKDKIAQSFLIETPTHLTLTPQGRLFLDRVLQGLL